MGKITRHPLFATADALKRAFAINGFTVLDDGVSSELQTTDWALSPYYKPESIRRTPIVLEEHGEYAMRCELITSMLPQMRGTLPIKSIAIGRVYDAKDAPFVDHLVVAGVIAQEDIEMRHLEKLFKAIAKQTYGIEASAKLELIERETYRIVVTASDTFTFGYIGKGEEIARALLGLSNPDISMWSFTIDVDSVVMHDLKLSNRSELYNPNVSFLSQFEDDTPAFGDSFTALAIDTLRKHGFQEFSGERLYEEDAYKKMNMIMESWDLNNRGFFLKEPLGSKVRIPTVRTPALQDALEANYKAGEKTVRLFEIGQHFVSDANGRNPELKTSLSVGAYGPGIDKKSFRAEVDSIMSDLGVSNHFFIPVTIAIPYDPTDCWVLMDERMEYLGGNFGTINKIALDYHELGVEAFMLQIEMKPLEKKALEEFDTIPNELL